MNAEYKAKYAEVEKISPYVVVRALNEKKLSAGTTGSILLEDVTIKTTSEGITIKGTKISVFDHWKFRCDSHIYAKDIPALRLIYNPETDIVQSLILRRRVLREGLYEKEVKKDFELVSNIRWLLTSSNGETLSSEELA